MNYRFGFMLSRAAGSRFHVHRAACFGVAVLSGLPSFAGAATIPDAGTLERQLQQPPAPPPSTAVPRVPAPVPPPGADTGPRILVKGFVIEGGTLVPEAELQAAIADRIGRSLGLPGLQDAAQAVADAYRRHGYFARAYLPPQDVGNGVVRIVVVEGRFGAISMKPGETRMDPDIVQRIVGNRLVPGQPYSADDIERGLMIANDLPGVSVDGVLKAGSATGTSDIAVSLADTPLVTGNVGINNFGIKSTGAGMGLASVTLNDPGGIGDQLSLRGQVSDGLGFGQMDYSLPLGYSGLRGGVSASYLRYTLGGDFSDLDAHGSAITFAANLLYPVLRTPSRSNWAGLSYRHSRYDDSSLGVALDRKNIDALDASFSGNWSDGLGGGAITSYALTVSGGRLDLSGVENNKAADKAGPKTDGGYGKFALQASRGQALGPDWFVRARLNLQGATGNLDSSEQISLGGPGGVRAYPVDEAQGDEGVIGNLELHRPLSGGWASGLDLYGFVDAGMIRQHVTRWTGWDGGTGLRNNYALYGTGLGLGYAAPYGVMVSLVGAVPIGPNPGSGPSGDNQDGSRRGARLWLNLFKSF